MACPLTPNQRKGVHLMKDRKSFPVVPQETMTKLVFSGRWILLGVTAMLSLSISLLAQGPSSAPGPTRPSAPNVETIALLKWYSVDQAATISVASVPTPGPLSMAFDGANMWVTNYGFP